MSGSSTKEWCWWTVTLFGEGVTVCSSFPVGIPENVIITSNSLFLGKFLVLSKKIRDLLKLNEGSVVELDRLAGDPLDILANGTTIAKGEVVMVGERFGIRFTEVADPEERVQNL